MRVLFAAPPLVGLFVLLAFSGVVCRRAGWPAVHAVLPLRPTPQSPLFGEFDVVVLVAVGGLRRRGVRRAAGCSSLLVERYGFLGGMGTAAGVTFCGLHANVHGEIRQVVQGVADDLLRASTGSAA